MSGPGFDRLDLAAFEFRNWERNGAQILYLSRPTDDLHAGFYVVQKPDPAPLWIPSEYLEAALDNGWQPNSGESFWRDALKHFDAIHGTQLDEAEALDDAPGPDFSAPSASPPDVTPEALVVDGVNLANFKRIVGFWPKIVRRVRELRPTLSGSLAAARPHVVLPDGAVVPAGAEETLLLEELALKIVCSTRYDANILGEPNALRWLSALFGVPVFVSLREGVS